MGSNECRDINELHPKVKELALKLIEVCKEQGINIAIGETYRTVERQNYLYEQGRTRQGNIVTNAKGSSMNSYHQWHLAFDIFNNIKGDAYNLQVLQKAGKLGQALGLEWGGAWKGFRDNPHFQYTFGLSLADLKAGKQPPNDAQEELDKEYIKAVEALSEKGIIQDIKYWSELRCVNPNNVETLLIKTAAKLKLEVIKSYTNAVKVCNEFGIITNLDKWLHITQITSKDIIAFIKKAHQLI